MLASTFTTKEAIKMDYNLIDKLNKAYQNMLYGIDLLYIIQCALDYCKGLELGSEAASSIYIAWERLDQASKEIFLCIDSLQTEFESRKHFGEGSGLPFTSHPAGE